MKARPLPEGFAEEVAGPLLLLEKELDEFIGFVQLCPYEKREERIAVFMGLIVDSGIEEARIRAFFAICLERLREASRD